MARIDQLKQEIEKLSPEERAELVAWLHGWEDDAWDRQMKEDAKAGRLDSLIDEIDRERHTGEVFELDDVLKFDKCGPGGHVCSG